MDIRQSAVPATSGARAPGIFEATRGDKRTGTRARVRVVRQRQLQLHNGKE